MQPFHCKRKSRTAAFFFVLCMLLSVFPATTSTASRQQFSQTPYRDLTEFQDARYLEIQNDIFVSKESGRGEFTSRASAVEIQKNLGTDGGGKAQVSQRSTYFNWVDSEALRQELGIEPWDGGSDEPAAAGTQTYHYEDVAEFYTPAGSASQKVIPTEITTTSDVTYEVYNVSTAAEFRGALEKYAAEGSKHVKINLTADINLNGVRQTWEPCEVISGNGSFYLEGNGHTIYNMRAYHPYADSSGLFSSIRRKTIVKNLNFKSCISLAGYSGESSEHGCGTLYGSLGSSQITVYLYNVHGDEGYVQADGAYAGGLVGVSGGPSRLFVKSCSTSGYVVFETMHTAGFMAYAGGVSPAYNVKYDAPFPQMPEAYNKDSNKRFGIMVEDCYSVDSRVFSYTETGSAADSGAMFSCMSGTCVRNCYTNNIMYGNEKVGAFLGRVIVNNASSSRTIAYFDDAGRPTVNSYFENCYASGIVEGNDKIGGFAGMIDSQNNPAAGTGVIFKNCYSTAMVGMDYAGTGLGGFMGRDMTPSGLSVMTVNLDGRDQEIPGSVYINCYAAGEVGNILTDTTPQVIAADDSDKDRIGGFIGAMAYQPGSFFNCYYDVQTTAMRERAYGMDVSLEGVTGVYTLDSTVKGVKGLTYDADNPDRSVRMEGSDASGSAWVYTEEYYPALQVFAKTGTDSSFYVPDAGDVPEQYSAPVSGWYDTDTVGVTTRYPYDPVRTTNRFSQASTSTVFLNHWDSIMDMRTGALPNENNWVCGVADNRMTYNEAEGRWEIAYEDVAPGTYEFKV